MDLNMDELTAYGNYMETYDYELDVFLTDLSLMSL